MVQKGKLKSQKVRERMSQRVRKSIGLRVELSNYLIYKLALKHVGTLNNCHSKILYKR